MRIIQWTKEGWTPRIATTEEVKNRNSIRPTYEPISSSMQNNETGEFKLFKNITDKIQAGVPQSEIDALPANLRMLYETNGRFFVGSYGVFKKQDPIEQVYESKEWGNDKDDNIDLEDENLEDESMVMETMHNEQQRLAESIMSSYQSEIDEADLNGDSTLCEVLKDQCVAELRNISTDKEYMYSINSRFCGYGYSSPKQKVDTVYKNTSNEMGDAADKRKQNFEELFKELSFCREKFQIYGRPTKEGNSWVGGIMNKVRDLYFQDKALIVEWSEEARLKARKEFVSEWRSNPTKDEESLRQELYWRFDRSQSVQPAKLLVDKEGETKLLKDEYRTKASKWENDKSKAYLQMYMTMGQWKAFYQLKDLLIKRIDLNYKEDSDRDIAINILRDEFKSIETSEDLAEYIKRANHRVWETKQITSRTYKDTYNFKGRPKQITRKKIVNIQSYVFQPSLVDRISTKDELRWKKAIQFTAKKLVSTITNNKEE